MLKNLTSLEHAIGDKVYKFVCDVDAPILHVHESLCQFSSYVLGIINSQKPQEEAAVKPQEEVEEEKEGS